MKKFAIALIATALLVACGRSWSLSDYMAIHKDGLQRLEISRHLNAQYEEVDNFIVHFGSKKQPLEWQTVAFIGGRFELTLVLPVTVDYAKRTLMQAGKPTIHLWAAKEIRVLPDGRMETTLDPKLERTFGEEDWGRLVQSGFDLTTLGIPKEEIHSVPHWEEHVRGSRKDRVPIK